jgi:putative phosphoserine phosphatase/1-acylglycerol-3-phosphate O-acyltransferase
MSPELEQLLAEIEAGPKGPEVGAFFDFDGTLIAGYSGMVFFRDRIRRLQVSAGDLARSALAGLDMEFRGADVSKLMSVWVGGWAGRREDELEELGERLFVKHIADLVYPEARALVKAHERMGHTIALASSATRFQAWPLARDLGVELLCTPVEVAKGVVTGRLGGPILWGEGKAKAVRDFAAHRGIDLAQSYAYGNGDEDVPFLEVVGRPRPLNPQGGLVEVARERGWPLINFATRGGRPGLSEVVRTGAALSGLMTATAVGAGIALLNRNRRQGANVMSSIGPNLVLALAGVEVRVVGEENVWSHRPAVFLFNHQSNFDIFVLGHLLQRDFSGVAKKEAARDPFFAPMGYLTDVAYVDRGNTTQAKEALAPAVDRLRKGISIAVAPEGTRSATPTVGPFKKGAFHMAMQADVPVVPIVIRNAGELMGRSAKVMKPGVIDVAVLEPIPTRAWKAEDLDAHVAEVRQRYVDTLENWPAPD